ncbi:MAG: hypothetical protein V4722_04275 [Bacteroidota bacterium]
MSTFSSYNKPGTPSVIFDNVAAMRAHADLVANAPYELKGYFYENDGGGGSNFIYNPLSTAADNGGTVFKPTSVGAGAGAFIRNFNGDVSPEWFGGIANKENITVDVTGLTVTKKIITGIPVLGGEHPTPGTGSGKYRYIGNNIVDSEPTALDGTNVMIIYAPLSPVINIGDVIEQFRGGVWVRLGIVYAVYTNIGGDPQYGVRIKNELGLGNDGVFYDTRVKRLTTSAFTAKHVGQTMVIAAARLFTAFNTMPVGLNCKIVSVDGGGVATIVNLDTSRGDPANTTGTFSNGAALSNAVIFTNATDGIANAIKYCQDNSQNLQFPGGRIGIMPVFSQAWANNPEFVATDYTVTKSPFMIKGNCTIKSAGIGKTFLSVHYAVPNRVGDTSIAAFSTGRDCWEFFCYLFFCEPTANTSTKILIEDFTVEFPDDPSTNQPYLLIRDYGGNSYPTPQRHAQKITVNRVGVKCPQRNVKAVESNYGDIFDNTFDAVAGYNYTGVFNGATTYAVNDIALINGLANVWTGAGFVPWNNNLLDYASISFTDCDFETAGFDIKHAIVGDPTKYCGKQFNLVDTTVRTGVYRVYRHYTGSYTATAGDDTVTFNEAHYSPYLPNLHYDYQNPRNIFLTPLEIKKRETGIVQSIAISGLNYLITLTANYAGATNAHGKLWAEPGDYKNEMYIDIVNGDEAVGGVSLVNGSPVVTVPIAATGRTLAEMDVYKGKTIRLYSLIDYVQITSFGDNRSVRVGLWDTRAAGYGETHALTTNCIGLSNLDICVNATFDTRGRGNSGHPFYNHHNIFTTLIRFKLLDCPNLLRISTEGSLMRGKFVSIDSPMPITKGLYAISANTAAHQVYSQFEGEVHMENGGFFKNDYGVFGTFKNTHLRSVSLYAPSIVENCTFEQVKLYPNYYANKSPLTKLSNIASIFSFLYAGADIEATKFDGLLYVNCGKIKLSKSAVDIQLDYEGVSWIADQLTKLAGTSVICEDCQISNYAGYHAGLTTAGKLLFKNNFRFIRSGVIPNDLNTIGNSGLIPYDYTIGTELWPTPVSYNGAFVISYPQPGYPVAVLDGAAISTSYPSVIGRILFVDARYGIYRIGATYIDDINISNRIHNISFDYRLYAQARYADGATIVLIPTEAGFVTNATARLFPLNEDERPVDIPIKLVYGKLLDKWFEVPYYNQS